MPPASKHLDVNEVKCRSFLRFDWNTPGLSLKGATTARSTVNGNVKYDVILDLVPGISLTLPQNCLKHIKTNSNDTLGNIEHAAANTTESIVTKGSANFLMNINFTEYMSYRRFKDIPRMHMLEAPSPEHQGIDALYRIRSTVDAFDEHIKTCLESCKYSKVPRKPHPTRQEFKILAEYHTKEYNSNPVIADSRFGSPNMTMMLAEPGLYSTMQVTKRYYWPCGMPTTDIAASVGNLYGAHFTMKKITRSERIFVCAYRDHKINAFTSSCSTTRLARW
ncbi:hypothetical protein K493DRAFT_302114 [Basidiobolus meristosporus CBS 931.73]|uniref:Uncharacterized protein n=1 Tax=Basidiobolus meristosporus CBS 931.73 TaxID=1314790 RepID=A0A1Y1Y8L7_9FUNG|nr:hypothetical protein K493DRAFT_302114 [Basidiobolus meristosporus CBS 931.73]|eukprot:ORX94339.1 hypothetical protein K493DRAFT_302114 [Basidiobolus meristosporus CBS 931.73]